MVLWKCCRKKRSEIAERLKYVALSLALHILNGYWALLILHKFLTGGGRADGLGTDGKVGKTW